MRAAAISAADPFSRGGEAGSPSPGANPACLMSSIKQHILSKTRLDIDMIIIIEHMLFGDHGASGIANNGYSGASK